MDDKDVVGELVTLRRLEPDNRTLQAIRQRVMNETVRSAPRRKVGFMQSLNGLLKPQYSLALTMMLLLVFSYSMLVYTNPMPRAVSSLSAARQTLSTTAASQQAEQDTIASIVREESTLDNLQHQMTSLDAKGVLGQYTKQECYSVYYDYEEYLVQYQELVAQALSKSTAPDNRVNALAQKISQYKIALDRSWPDK